MNQGNWLGRWAGHWYGKAKDTAQEVITGGGIVFNKARKPVYKAFDDLRDLFIATNTAKAKTGKAESDAARAIEAASKRGKAQDYQPKPATLQTLSKPAYLAKKAIVEPAKTEPDYDDLALRLLLLECM